MRCASCMHFNSFDCPDASAEPDLSSGRGGVCRRYPPKVFSPSWDDLGRLTVTSTFPQVHPDQRCGEYAADNGKVLVDQAKRYAIPSEIQL